MYRNIIYYNIVPMPNDSKQIKKIIILLIIFAVVYQVYNFSYKAKHGDILSNIKFADVPDSVKCFFNEPGCSKGNIDGWSLMHGLMFLIIGLIVPNQYFFVIIISIALEILQPFIGNNARYILNPLINLTGYAVGSVINRSTCSFKEKYQVLV